MISFKMVVLMFGALFTVLSVTSGAYAPIESIDSTVSLCGETEITAAIQSTNDVEFSMDLIVIGDPLVGKSSLLNRYSQNKFTIEIRPTIGLELSIKSICFDQNRIKAFIWDLAGRERYRSVITSYYHRAIGALIVFDIANWVSFANAERWLRELRRLAPVDIVIMLVGNKSDLECNRAVSGEEAVSFASKNGLFYIETSALASVSVQEAFKYTIEECYNVALERSGKNRRTAAAVASDIPFIPSVGTRIDFDFADSSQSRK